MTARGGNQLDKDALAIDAQAVLVPSDQVGEVVRGGRDGAEAANQGAEEDLEPHRGSNKADRESTTTVPGGRRDGKMSSPGPVATRHECTLFIGVRNLLLGPTGYKTGTPTGGNKNTSHDPLDRPSEKNKSCNRLISHRGNKVRNHGVTLMQRLGSKYSFDRGARDTTRKSPTPSEKKKKIEKKKHYTALHYRPEELGKAGTGARTWFAWQRRPLTRPTSRNSSRRNSSNRRPSPK
jgi:hypothetical protein